MINMEEIYKKFLEVGGITTDSREVVSGKCMLPLKVMFLMVTILLSKF